MHLWKVYILLFKFVLSFPSILQPQVCLRKSCRSSNTFDGVFRVSISWCRMPAKWGGVEQCPACVKSVYPTDRVGGDTQQFHNGDDDDIDDDKDNDDDNEYDLH